VKAAYDSLCKVETKEGCCVSLSHVCLWRLQDCVKSRKKTGL